MITRMSVRGTSTRGIKYNLQPAVTTGEEEVFGVHHHTKVVGGLPVSFDLRTAVNYVPPILDQLQLGACSSNALSNALRFCIGKELGFAKEWQPSRLFLYYFGRLYEGSDVHQDTGTSISGVCGAVAKYGACVESLWKYDISKFAVQPPRAAITSAHAHTSNYKFLQVPQDLDHVKHAIFSGFPVIIGIQVYDSFESDAVAQSGIVPMPNVATESCLGGHAIEIWKFNDITKTVTCSNSWGPDWGQKGFFTLSYDYILDPNLAGDFCQVRYFR